MSSFYWEQILVCHLKGAKQTETEMEKLREMEKTKIRWTQVARKPDTTGTFSKQPLRKQLPPSPQH
jgi:hypothetical protein